MQRKVGGQCVSLGVVRERAGSGFWEILRCDESDGTIVCCFRAMWKGACERKEHAMTRRRWWWRRGTHCFVTFRQVNDDARVAVHHTRSGQSSQYLSSSKRRHLLPPPTTRCRRQLTNQPVTSNDAQRSAMYPPSQRRRRRRAHPRILHT